MPEWSLLAVVVSSALGLLLGRAAYAFWIAFTCHAPECPAKSEVMDRAHKVQIDVEELLSRKDPR